MLVVKHCAGCGRRLGEPHVFDRMREALYDTRLFCPECRESSDLPQKESLEPREIAPLCEALIGRERRAQTIAEALQRWQ